MQNLGVAYAVIPLIQSVSKDSFQTSQMLSRHLKLFNTHPYLASPVMGAVVKLEEQTDGGMEVMDIKQTLMGPYAAMGDAFFWGAWRPFSVIGAALLLMEGLLWAPLVFLVMYNPVPFYVRLKGFIEGYRQGMRSVDFIGGLNLPGLAGKIRWASILLLGLLAMLLSQRAGHAYAVVPDLLLGFFFLGVILICFWMITRGISVMKILYGVVAFLLLLSF